MPTTELNIDGVGIVFLTRKPRMKSIRIRIDVDNSVKISAPRSATRRQIIAFITDKQDWIRKHRTSIKNELYDGMHIGSQGQLIIQQGQSNKVSLRGHNITVTTNSDHLSYSLRSKVATKAAEYLKRETEAFLFPRVLQIARSSGIGFNQLKARRLKSRWGSCDTEKNITLNVYLAQMPATLVDYVICHELAHTKQMNHSTLFWQEVQKLHPEYKQTRKLLKQYQPRLYDRSLVDL